MVTETAGGAPPRPGTCTLCKRAGQALVPGPAWEPQCADQASCLQARQLESCDTDAVYRRLGIAGPGRSGYRDAAERNIEAAEATRGTAPASAQVVATCAVAQALLAIADAITAVPNADLVSVLDAGLSQLAGSQ